MSEENRPIPPHIVELGKSKVRAMVSKWRANLAQARRSNDLPKIHYLCIALAEGERVLAEFKPNKKGEGL